MSQGARGFERYLGLAQPKESENPLEFLKFRFVIETSDVDLEISSLILSFFCPFYSLRGLGEWSVTKMETPIGDKILPGELCEKCGKQIEVCDEAGDEEDTVYIRCPESEGKMGIQNTTE